ncbi:MAG: phosphoribosylamine--glycine ligase [Deltaproteobacteria bacterium]|nr:phosphoribosylamine--glycine ligase [Deltaproteobacteria bacterium]
MRVLIVGGGGREHALAWALSRSPLKPTLLAAPGNPGIARLCECRPTKADDVPALVALAQREKIDLVVVGPEAPLAAGLADALAERGIRVFGPRKSAAELEASKAFAKQLMARAGVPTARFDIATTMAEAERAIVRISGGSGGVVVKADGLAAGKGVVVAESPSEARSAARRMLEENAFGEAGRRVVIEERLVGREASLIAITDGERVLPLVGCEDHKAVLDGDRGPNTGGMGVVSPTPALPPALVARALDEVVTPTVRQMAAEGRPLQGVIYAGLMIDGGKLSTLEFNCRFGDPETEAQLPRLSSDLLAVLDGAARGRLPEGELEWDARTAVCVIGASRGYPTDPVLGDRIQGLEEAESQPDVLVFHAGTRLQGGELYTAGGRVLAVTALGADVAAARTRAYAAMGKIRCQGLHYRKDIGKRGQGETR